MLSALCSLLTSLTLSPALLHAQDALMQVVCVCRSQISLARAAPCINFCCKTQVGGERGATCATSRLELDNMHLSCLQAVSQLTASMLAL